MFHPLSPNLSTLKDEEIHKRTSELIQRIGAAQRSGNLMVISQLQMLYSEYQEESQKRAQQWLEKLNKKKKPDTEDPTSYDIG